MPVTLVINPRTDDEFVEQVHHCAAEVNTAPQLQSRLRERYPRAVVRPRELDGERSEIWYVYRDGHWRPG